MIPPTDEDPSVEDAGDIHKKTAVENRGRQDRKVRQGERDIRKVAAALLNFHMNGTLSEVELESLTEIIRRR